MADVQIKQHIPIFVSSTYEDLIPYREEAQRILMQLEQIIKGMEFFGSDTRSSIEVCLSKVRECKLYIGIEQNRCAMACQGCGKRFLFFQN